VTAPFPGEPTLDRLRTRTSAKWRKYDPDVVPVWVADMDYPIAPAIRDVLSAHADLGDLGYASAVDDDAYRLALVDWLRTRHSWTVPLEHTHTIVDVLQGMAAALAVHTRPGDGIVLQTPAYPPMFDIITTADRRLIDNPLTADHRIDLDLLAHQASDARALLLCHPHNPTGRVFTEAELAAVVDIAVTHDLVIISDEIHADLVHDGHRHRPVAAVAGAADRTVTLTSASKTFGMPGLSCAAVVAPPALLDPIVGLPKGLLGHPSVVGLRAGCAAWRHAHDWLDAARSHIAANLHHAVDRLGSAGLGVSMPDATYLLWIDCRQLGWSDEPAERFLHEARVAFSPGPDFGANGAGFVRLNVATGRAVLDLALDRALALVDGPV